MAAFFQTLMWNQLFSAIIVTWGRNAWIFSNSCMRCFISRSPMLSWYCLVMNSRIRLLFSIRGNIKESNLCYRCLWISVYLYGWLGGSNVRRSVNRRLEHVCDATRQASKIEYSILRTNSQPAKASNENKVVLDCRAWATIGYHTNSKKEITAVRMGTHNIKSIF